MLPGYIFPHFAYSLDYSHTEKASQQKNNNNISSPELLKIKRLGKKKKPRQNQVSARVLTFFIFQFLL
ncbi:hypothetical protein OI18_11150 [Flavihumibacter solisilvae]|uniref:Uncharacterized protein n=1 Tax=Flavihumibacter solisilvae TaxID=1349421 RepID=A0A0C1IVY7_9BACT|nr:hypothetical protein OI18_11150 [Flavihumibacter solisilvae]